MKNKELMLQFVLTQHQTERTYLHPAPQLSEANRGPDVAAAGRRQKRHVHFLPADASTTNPGETNRELEAVRGSTSQAGGPTATTNGENSSSNPETFTKREQSDRTLTERCRCCSQLLEKFTVWTHIMFSFNQNLFRF